MKDPPRVWPHLFLGLLVVPASVTIAFVAAPRLALGEEGAAFGSFAGAASTAIVALALTALAPLSVRQALLLVATSVVALVTCALIKSRSPLTIALVDTALVAAAVGSGGSLGRRVQHPGHLLPASFVAACADIVSVVSPNGPSHAVVSSERALSLLAVSFPVPGTSDASPALGVGDLIFVALVLGVALAHGLPYLRIALLAFAGTLVAVAGSWCLKAPAPALPAIGALILAGVPAARRLRSEDRRVAAFGMSAAAVFAAATIATHYFE